MTPGTVSCRRRARTAAICWCTRCTSPTRPALVADIKARYEAPLKEIFE